MPTAACCLHEPLPNHFVSWFPITQAQKELVVLGLAHHGWVEAREVTATPASYMSPFRIVIVIVLGSSSFHDGGVVLSLTKALTSGLGMWGDGRSPSNAPISRIPRFARVQSQPAACSLHIGQIDHVKVCQEKGQRSLRQIRQSHGHLDKKWTEQITEQMRVAAGKGAR